VTATETILSEFWLELLELDAIAPADQFVDVGGNSLIATMLANRIEERFGVRPTVADILNRSLVELAEWCDEAVLARA
jgi:acyl carrier protein